jgi:hypothetical protein
VLQVNTRQAHLGRDQHSLTRCPEAQMRRFPLPIAFALILVAGCDAASPLDPSAAAPFSISASVPNDSTPAASPAEAADGGILIGSGT